MSLTVVSTPIGNYGDITLRAVETLKEADVVICEELKPARVLFKRIGIQEKELHQLNEHSKSGDLAPLVAMCRSKKVALISDCGTPGFCDPGADLVEACRREKIPVEVNPGASSLMTLLSLCGEKLNEFHFVGFLPAEKETRGKAVDQWRGTRVPLVIMDTPYRLKATLQDFALNFGQRTAVLGLDLTGEKHQVHKAPLSTLAQKDWPKEPFVLIILNK